MNLPARLDGRRGDPSCCAFGTSSSSLVVLVDVLSILSNINILPFELSCKSVRTKMKCVCQVTIKIKPMKMAVVAIIFLVDPILIAVFCCCTYQATVTIVLGIVMLYCCVYVQCVWTVFILFRLRGVSFVRVIYCQSYQVTVIYVPLGCFFSIYMYLPYNNVFPSSPLLFKKLCYNSKLKNTALFFAGNRTWSFAAASWIFRTFSGRILHHVQRTYFQFDYADESRINRHRSPAGIRTSRSNASSLCHWEVLESSIVIVIFRRKANRD